MITKRAYRRFPRVAQLGRQRPAVTRERVSRRWTASVPDGARNHRTRLTVVVARPWARGRKACSVAAEGLLLAGTCQRIRSG